MLWGKDQIVNILERDLPKDRRNFMVVSGTGKDCIVSIFINERGVQSVLYCDALKVVFIKIPAKVLPGLRARRSGCEKAKHQEPAILHARAEERQLAQVIDTGRRADLLGVPERVPLLHLET